MHLNGYWEVCNGLEHIKYVYNVEEAEKAVADGYLVIWRLSK
jgi:hypothetical protein